MLLRDSQHKGQATFDMVLDLADPAQGDDRFGYRSEYMQLVRTAKALAGK